MDNNHDSPLTTPSLINIKEYIDVTEPPFNAVGDGVADDSAAIQAAVDWFANNAPGTNGTGVVYFPTDKKFALGGTVHLPTDKDVRIQTAKNIGGSNSETV